MRPEVDRIKASAQGRWREILVELGGVTHGFLDGKNHPCPKCGGKDRFRLINVDRGALYCNRCFASKNGDGIAALQWLTGEDYQATLSRLGCHLGIGNGDGAIPSRGDKRKTPGTIVQTYQYHDEDGALVYEVVRYEPKGFRQRRPDGKGGWLWSLEGVRRVPYRLPTLISKTGRRVFIVEGEKDADSLTAVGLLATTSPQGAGKWRHLDHAAVEAAFRGRHVVILPDLDEPGREHGRDVARSIFPLAASVIILELPGAGKDVFDWLAAGGTRQALEALVRAAPSLTEAPQEDAKRPTNGTCDDAEPKSILEDADETDGARHVLLYVPPPIDALPGMLADFCVDTARAMACDVGLVAPHALAAVSGALGLARRARVSNRWCESGTLWVAVCAAPGSLKTPPWEEAMKPLRTLESERVEAAAPMLESYRQAKREHDRRARKTNPGPEPLRPPEPRILVDDVTVEGLAPILFDNPRGLLLAADELAGWIGGMNQYRNGRGSDVARWCRLHDGGALAIDRRTGEPRSLRLDHAAVAVSGSIQPRILREALGNAELWGSGFLARLLMCSPPGVVLDRLPPEVPEAGAYARMLRRAHELPMGLDSQGRHVPIDLAFDREARKCLDAWLPEHAEWVRSFDDEAPLRGPVSKLRGSAVRHALLIHVARWAEGNDPAPGSIDARSMEAGIAFVTWWKREIERVYAQALGGNVAAVSWQFLRLVKWFEERPGLEAKSRDVARSVPGYGGRGGSERAEADLERLVALGVLKRVMPPAKLGPGRPAPAAFALATRSAPDTIAVFGRNSAIVSGNSAIAERSDVGTGAYGGPVIDAETADNELPF